MREVRANVSLKRLAVAVAALVVVSAMALGLISGTFGGGLTGHSSVTRENAVSGSPAASSTAPGTSPTGSVGEPARPPRRVSATPHRPTARRSCPAPSCWPRPPGDKPDADTVAGRIRAVSRAGVGGVYSGSVVDVGTGKSLFNHRAGAAEIPASVNKLLTSAAVLSMLGPEHRFTTSVVRSGKKQIILVGGGDPYLASKTTSSTYPARASVADLAKTTAVALKKAKRTSVTLGYDAGLFTGPAWNPTWPSGYGDQVTPTSALWVDEGRLAGGSPGPRTSDPAGQAAQAFAAALRKQGIKVTDIAKADAEQGRPPDRRRLLHAAGADRRAGADDQRQRRRRGAVPPGRGGRGPDRLDQSGPPADEADPHRAQGLARGHRRPGRQRTLPRQPDRRRHLVPAAPARGRGMRTQSSGA